MCVRGKFGIIFVFVYPQTEYNANIFLTIERVFVFGLVIQKKKNEKKFDPLRIIY